MKNEKSRRRSRSRDKERNVKEKESFQRNLTKNIEEYEGEELRRKVRALIKSFYGYTDDENPFGDPDLSKPFIWTQKIHKMRSRNLEPFLDTQSLIVKLKDAKDEIERIRNSRMAREELREKIEDEKNRGNKELEDQKYLEMRQKDEKFHLAQEKLRTEIRIKQGREKPVDFIYKVLLIWKNLFPIPSDFAEIPEYHQPYLLYDLLDNQGLNELYEELKIQLKIDIERLANKTFICFFMDIASNFQKQHNISEQDLKDFIEYWKCMIEIIESYIYPEKNIKNLSEEVHEVIKEILKDKQFSELKELEKEMEDNISQQYLSSDIQFWKNALQALRIHRCKMVIDKLYDEFKAKNIENLDASKKNNEDRHGVLMKVDAEKTKWTDEGNLSPPMYESDEEVRRVALSQHDYLIKMSETRKILLVQKLSKWQNSLNKDPNLSTMMPQQSLDIMGGSSSPKAIMMDEHIEKEAQMFKRMINSNLIPSKKEEEINSDEEVEKFLSKGKKKLQGKNNQSSSLQNTNNSNLELSSFSNQNLYNKNQSDLLLGTGCYPINTLKASRFYLKDDAMFDIDLSHEMMQIESEELGDGETIFNDIVPLSNNNYMWASKYKPRKPRYFNRVRTGYEWNKYHQVHYDYENPPPKVIQGYKFNIFYPDLIDKTKAPQYSLERSDTPGTCILRFHAGPPYEDIAFKIVNREWDMTEKAGFRNVFDRGILYLYFNFKRYRYKR
jgi:hypothetical protein